MQGRQGLVGYFALPLLAVIKHYVGGLNMGKLIGKLEGHKHNVNGVQILQDGTILSFSNDNTLRKWSQDGKLITVFEGHTSGVSCVKQLPDGRIISCDDASNICLWDNSGSLLKNSRGSFVDLCSFDDGRILWWPRDAQFLVLADKDLNGTKFLTKGHKQAVKGCIILKDGRLLSWSLDKTLCLWDQEYNPVNVLKGHKDSVAGAVVLPNGNFLSWAFEKDNAMRMWDNDGKPQKNLLQGHTGRVTGVDVFPDGRILSWAGDEYSSKDNTLRLWDSAGKIIVVMDEHKAMVRGAEILSDGKILSWSNDKTLRLWDNSGVQLSVMEGHSSPIKGVKVLPDGRIISWDAEFPQQLYIWSKEGKLLQKIEGDPDSGISDVAVLSNDRVVTYYCGDEYIAMWDVS